MFLKETSLRKGKNEWRGRHPVQPVFVLRWGAWGECLHSVSGKSLGPSSVSSANGIREEGQKAQLRRGDETDDTLLPGAASCEALTPREQGGQLLWGSRGFQGPHLVTGKGLRSQDAEQEAQTIHEENIAKLQTMAPEEILQEQQRLLAQLGMAWLAFLLSLGSEGIATYRGRLNARARPFAECLNALFHPVLKQSLYGR